MTDHHREIVVPLHVRYAIWPGAEWVLVEATAEKIGTAYWLTDQCGRSHELRPYRFGMLRGRR